MVLLACVYFLPVRQEKEKKKDDLFARLISPEDLKMPDRQPPQVIPRQQQRAKALQPLPPRSKAAPEVTRTPFLPAPPRLSEERPVVPGEGRESGRPLPEGIYPGAGSADRGEEKRGTGTALPAKPSRQGPLERERLYDQGIIGDLAEKDTERFPGKENGITFDTREYRYMGYMRKLREKIENIWVYPPEARAKGIYGDLKIRFTIRRDGRLGAVELVRTSGYRMLDEAALKALKDGEPYWPLPEEWGMDSYMILGHFIYSLGGPYLR